jgi:hypothetical protein
MKKLLILVSLISTPAAAEVWATGKCTSQYGDRIEYILHDGNGFISYDNSTPEAMFSKKENDLGIITHIGSHGNLTMVVNLNNGRGYYVTDFDNGRHSEGNLSCKLGTMNR